MDNLGKSMVVSNLMFRKHANYYASQIQAKVVKTRLRFEKIFDLNSKRPGNFGAKDIRASCFK